MAKKTNNIHIRRPQKKKQDQIELVIDNEKVSKRNIKLSETDQLKLEASDRRFYNNFVVFAEFDLFTKQKRDLLDFEYDGELITRQSESMIKNYPKYGLMGENVIFEQPEKPQTPLSYIEFKKLTDDVDDWLFNEDDKYFNNTYMHGNLPELLDYYKGDENSAAQFTSISLNREFPDFRVSKCKTSKAYERNDLPKASVVIIFSNEPIDTLLRSVHSVLNRTPPGLLEDIVLVDDGSTNSDLFESLELHIQNIPKTKLYRNSQNYGIPRARHIGITKAAAEVFVILDSHIEVEEGWIQPLLAQIVDDPLAFVMPRIDSIDMPNNYKPLPHGIGCHIGLIWRLQDHAFIPEPNVSPNNRLIDDVTIPTTSPVMAGGLFGARKDLYFALGGYDFGMIGWGAENVEMSLRLWQCGARLYCSECSRVAHIFTRGQFYDTSSLMRDYNSNRARLAAVWLDEYVSLVEPMIGGNVEDILNKNRRQQSSFYDDLRYAFDLRRNLQCSGFQWFLNEVYPESHITDIAQLKYLGGLKYFQYNDDQDINNVKEVGCLTGGDKMRIVQRNDLAKVSKYNGIRCPHYMFWGRYGLITWQHDDETALRMHENSPTVSFDWNRDHSMELRYEVEILRSLPGKGDFIQIRDRKTNTKCLDIIGKSNMHIVTKDCKDVLGLWFWDYNANSDKEKAKNYFQRYIDNDL